MVSLSLSSWKVLLLNLNNENVSPCFTVFSCLSDFTMTQTRHHVASTSLRSNLLLFLQTSFSPSCLPLSFSFRPLDLLFLFSHLHHFSPYFNSTTPHFLLFNCPSASPFFFQFSFGSPLPCHDATSPITLLSDSPLVLVPSFLPSFLPPGMLLPHSYVITMITIK
jgi:hypothetical protein